MEKVAPVLLMLAAVPLGGAAIYFFDSAGSTAAGESRWPLFGAGALCLFCATLLVITGACLAVFRPRGR